MQADQSGVFCRRSRIISKYGQCQKQYYDEIKNEEKGQEGPRPPRPCQNYFSFRSNILLNERSPFFKWGPESNPTPTWVADLPVSKLNFIGVEDEDEEEREEEGRDVWAQKKHTHSHSRIEAHTLDLRGLVLIFSSAM